MVLLMCAKVRQPNFLFWQRFDATDFFYFSPLEDPDWNKVTVFKEKQITGFIHKSRILEFEKLDNIKQGQIILKTLKRQRELAEDFSKALDSNDEQRYSVARTALETYSEKKYNAILNVLPTYFCRTNDVEVLKEFFLTMWADNGSANEMVSFAIGDCFICNFELVGKEISKLNNLEHQTLLYEKIEWGLINQFEADNKKFMELKLLIEKARKKAK